MKYTGISNLIILGHMPFIGVSYQSIEKNLEYEKKFSNPEAIKVIVQTALNKGVRTFAAASSSSPLATYHIQILKDLAEKGTDIEVIPCVGIPISLQNNSIDAFRRWATYVEFESKIYPESRKLILNDPILNFRDKWKEKLPISRPYTKKEFQMLKIDWDKLGKDLTRFEDLPVSYMEPGSETDFLVIAKRYDLLGDLIDYIQDHGFKEILFGVHHAGVTIPNMDKEVGRFSGYLTPINSMGIMMLPTKESAVEAIRNTRKSVFAIKPLAGGRIIPRAAFKYVFSFDIDGCMVGVSSMSELDQDLKAAEAAIRGIN